jgi:hypothetical protein
MRDPEPVELGRQPRDAHLDDPPSHPAGLEPRPGHDRRTGGERDDQQPGQTESFSVTGSTETT